MNVNKWKPSPDAEGIYWASRNGRVSIVCCVRFPSLTGGPAWVRDIGTRQDWTADYYDGFMGPLPEPEPIVSPKLSIVRGGKP